MKIRYIAMTLAIMSLIILTPSRNAYASSYWTQKNGSWYYLSDSSKIVTGWIKDAGNWYYLGADGKMNIGWIKDGGNWYYLNSDGSMAHDTTIGSYYLGSNGAWTTAPASSATGISYSELLNRVEGLGFTDRQSFSEQESYGDYGSGTAFMWNDNTYGGITIYDKGMFNVDLLQNNAEFNRAVKQIFNWLLPTQGDELIRILTTTAPKNQTLTMDGRTVEIEIYGSSLSITIKG